MCGGSILNCCPHNPHGHERALKEGKEYMIQMEFAIFMFKFNNQMLPDSFDEYFIKLDKIYNYYTRQKHLNESFQSYIGSERRRKLFHHICLDVWRSIPQSYRHCSFSKYKNYYKNNRLGKYDSPQ